MCVGQGIGLDPTEGNVHPYEGIVHPYEGNVRQRTPTVSEPTEGNVRQKIFLDLTVEIL
jgi:hypothetical protein